MITSAQNQSIENVSIPDVLNAGIVRLFKLQSAGALCL